MTTRDDAVMEIVQDAQSPALLPSLIKPLGPGASQAWHYLHDQVHTEVFNGGSAGPGKTFNACLWEVTSALKYQGTAGAMFRSTAENLRKSTIVTYFEVCQKARLTEGMHYKFNESKGIVKWVGGSWTEFDYLKYEPRDPNYSRLGGRAYTRATADEGDEIEERAMEVLTSRIRYRLTEFCHLCAAKRMAELSEPVDCDDSGLPTQWACYNCGEWTRGLLPKMLITGNPGDYWTKYRYVFTKEGAPVRLPPHRAAVLMLLDDNPDKAHVAVYRKQLENLDDDYDKERLLLGNWNAVRRTGREFLHAYRSKDHVRAVPFDPELPLHITFDFNTAPYMTLLIAQLHLDEDGWFERYRLLGPHNQGRWHVAFLQEICLAHPLATTEATCQAFMRELTHGRYKGHRGGVIYYGDATGRGKSATATAGLYHNYDIIKKQLSRKLYNGADRVIRKNPNHQVVRDFSNSALRGERQFFVTFAPEMYNTQADMLNVKEGADGSILKVMETDHVTGVRYEKYGHCLQSHYYLTVAAFPKEFRRFVRK